MNKDIEIYLKKCIVCNKLKNNNIKKEKQKTKTIFSKGPRDRYVADLWSLPVDLS